METLFIGRNIIFLPEVDSTNSYAINLLKNVNATDGTVIHTANQTKGKGQRGNVWNTQPESNLTFSVILKPTFLNITKQFYLYQIAALACYDVLSELLKNGQFDIKIKWPNDILVGTRKIAGILIENTISNYLISNCVIGVGLNVKQCEFDEKVNATSLSILTQKDFELRNVLSMLCSQLEKYYLMLKSGQFDKVNETYMRHFFKLNSWQDFEVDGHSQQMLVKGLSPSGLLLLENKDGKQMEFDLKQVKWIY